MTIQGLDHLVLTVRSIEKTISFYCDVLGLTAETFNNGRMALKFGSQKFNLHEVGREFEPKAAAPVPGSQDFCLVVELLSDYIKRLKKNGISIIEGPVEKVGALGILNSVYIRDPDGNLIELGEYQALSGHTLLKTNGGSMSGPQTK